MTLETPENLSIDPRQKAILGAAFEAFRQYGFRRTAMEDIARGAGMSRAALYLHYRNKEDIFRSLAAYYYQTAEQAIRAELRPGRPMAEALPAAFRAQAGELFEALLTSPHGDELLDTKYANAADVAEAGEARLAEIYADWLTGEATAGRCDLSPYGGDARAVVATILAGLHGMKAGQPSYADYRARADRLGAMFGRALAVGG